MAAVDAPIVSGTESLDSMNAMRQELPPGPPTGESVSNTEISFASQTKKRKLTNEFVGNNIIIPFWEFNFRFFNILCFYESVFLKLSVFKFQYSTNLYKWVPL